MYFFGFLFAVIVGRRLLERPMFSSLRDVEMSDLIAVSAMGVVLGGRLGMCCFTIRAIILIIRRNYESVERRHVFSRRSFGGDYRH